MINDVIKSQIAAGKNAAEVRTHLRVAGYTEEEIDNNIAAIKKARQPPAKRNSTYWFIVAGFLFTLKGIGHFYQHSTLLGGIFILLGLLNFFAFAYYKD